MKMKKSFFNLKISFDVFTQQTNLPPPPLPLPPGAAEEHLWNILFLLLVPSGPQTVFPPLQPLSLLTVAAVTLIGAD